MQQTGRNKREGGRNSSMKIRLKEQNRSKAFTLVELLIVVIIIGILASIGVASYRKVIVKAKVGKAKHAISLIAEAEKIWQIDNESYAIVAPGSVDGTIGTNKTGINLAAVDNDTDFNYSVTVAGVNGTVHAVNSVVIGTCAVGNTISFGLNNGTWGGLPGCWY